MQGRKLGFRIFSATCFFFSAFSFSISSANAASLNIVGGELVGAFDVDVGGDFFDVEFLDGTCASLFSGCNSNSDIPFPSNLQAAAVNALRDQVFSGSVFDISPELTRGCESTSACGIVFLTAIFDDPSANIAASGFLNTTLAGGIPTFIGLGRFENTNTLPQFTYAVWSPTTVIPIPAAAWLFGSALLGFVGLNRRKTRTQW